MYDTDTDEEYTDPFEEMPAPVCPFRRLTHQENDEAYTVFMRNEAAAAHARYFMLTPENRENIRSWEAFARRFDSPAAAA